MPPTISIWIWYDQSLLFVQQEIGLFFCYWHGCGQTWKNRKGLIDLPLGVAVIGLLQTRTYTNTTCPSRTWFHWIKCSLNDLHSLMILFITKDMILMKLSLIQWRIFVKIIKKRKSAMFGCLKKSICLDVSPLTGFFSFCSSAFHLL